MTHPIHGFTLTPDPGDHFTRTAAQSLIGQHFTLQTPTSRIPYHVTNATPQPDGTISVECAPLPPGRNPT